MAGTDHARVPERTRGLTGAPARRIDGEAEASGGGAAAGCSASPRPPCGFAGGQIAKRIPSADLDERDPDYIRERLPAHVAAGEPVLPRRGPRPGQRPRGRARAARRQPLRRQPHPRQRRLHAGVQRLLRRRARALRARPQPRPLVPGPGLPAQVRHHRRLAGERRARRSTPARRCSSTPAATTRSTARRGSATRSTSAGARAGSASRSTRTSRSSRSWRSAARRPRCSSRAARALAKLLQLDRAFRLKVLPISLAIPWG